MKMRTSLACAAIMTLAIAAGCGSGGGGGEKPPATHGGGTPPPAAHSSTPTPAPATGGATVTLTGSIKLEGAAPARSPLKMNADAVCAKAHATAALSEDAVVDANGMVKWVFVYVKAGLEGQEFETPTAPVTFDQHGCQYSPHVFGIMVNQPLKILNSDPTLHNIHALPAKGEFNLGMPRQGMEFTKSFVQPEVMVKIKCDVHPWMGAYAGVLSHPFYAVTDDAGKFSIPNLPAGQYTIEAWHEKFGAQTQSVTVGTTPTQELNFTFAAAGS